MTISNAYFYTFNNGAGLPMALKVLVIVYAAVLCNNFLDFFFESSEKCSDHQYSQCKLDYVMLELHTHLWQCRKFALRSISVDFFVEL